MNEREERAQVRRLLYRWGNVACFCAAKHREMQDFKELLKGVADLHPSPITGMPRGTETSDPTARLAELAEVYKERIADYQVDIGIELDFAAAIDSLVQELDPDERAVVEQRYKHGKNATAAAQKLSTSESCVERADRSALDKIRSWIDVTALC